MTNTRNASPLFSLGAGTCAFVASAALFAGVFISSPALLATAGATALGCVLCLREKHSVRETKPRTVARRKPVLARVP